MVDLNECSPGDYLITRNGDLCVYKKRRTANYQLIYPHIVSHSTYQSNIALTDEGKHYRFMTSFYDIIEIVPQTNSNTPYFELYEKLRLYKRASAVA